MMPKFSEEDIAKPDSIESAWMQLNDKSNCSCDSLLLPKSLPMEKRIVWLERLRQYAVSKHGDLSVLKSFSDTQGLVLERRPDPNFSQWLWLYTQIGERHRISPIDQVIGIMACRDALLPFLESVPDKTISEYFYPIQETVQESPVSYPEIEEAIQTDAPSKLRLNQIMSNTVSEEQILSRAMFLEKSEIITAKLEQMSIEQCVRTLIKVHTEWKDPLPLFQKALPLYADKIADWHDQWGNGFFWYLYRRPIISRPLIEGLPVNVLATFNKKNVYGISPADLWIYYRPRGNLGTNRQDEVDS